MKNRYIYNVMNWRRYLIPIISYLQGSRRFLYLNNIIELGKLPKSELKKVQEEKLKELLIHSYKNVPYYSRVLVDCGVIQNGRVFLENFEKIPLLTKDIIKAEFDNIQSIDMKKRKSYENHSGGSTGEPTNFIQDKYYDDWNIANKIYYKTLGGYFLGEREMRLWGSEKDFLEGKESLSIRLRNFVFNRRDLNAFTMTVPKMRNYVDEINVNKPIWIESYVQPMYELSLFIEKNNLKIHSPQGVLTSAGTLYPEIKDTIERVFNCKVWNRYGSREVGDIAFGVSKLEISAWNNKVEVLNKDKNGMGRVIVTNLNNYSFPLIRYEIGDIASEGSEWGWLDSVEGREMSVVRTKKGKIVPGEFFIHFLGVVMNNDVIKKFQIIQKDYVRFEIRVVLNDKERFNEEKVSIEKLFDDVMEYECYYEWVPVEDIKTLKSGKYLYIKSEL